MIDDRDAKRRDERCVIVLKPDGYASQEIRSYANYLIQESGIEIISRYTLTFNEEDVLDLWPKFQETKYPISRELSFIYMTSGASEVIVVKSKNSNVEQKCLSIKSTVRSIFGTGMFCNCLHTPTGEVEIASAISKLYPNCAYGKAFSRHIDRGETLGIWGRLEQEERDLLKKAAKMVWDRSQSEGWESIKREMLRSDYNLYLLPGDPHSIDYGMSILHELMDEWTVEDTLSAYLEAEALGKSLLSSDKYPKIKKLNEEIRRHGLFTKTVESEGSS